MEQLKADYEHIFCINLLKKDKSGESILTEAFEKHILNNDLPYVKYEYFDLHHVCKNQRFDFVNPLIEKISGMVDNFNFYAEDLRNNTVVLT